MGLYDAMKDAVNMAQKADNIELYKQLLDLSAQALDLQAEVAKLREENAELRKRQNVSAKIVRHEGAYITLTDDKKELYYCSRCWDMDERLVQLNCNQYNGTFECPHCHMTGEYDSEKKQRVDQAQFEIVNSSYEELIKW